MKKRLLAGILCLCMLLSVMPTMAFAAESSSGEGGTVVSVSTREELKAALNNSSVSEITLTKNIDMGSTAWRGAVIAKGRILTINGGGFTISNMTVTEGNKLPSGTGVAGDGGSCDYYAGWIASNLGNLTINDLKFDCAMVDINPVTTGKLSTGSSILAVVCANNMGTLVYNDVEVSNSIVKGYTKVGILHGFSQSGGTFTANHCAVTDSQFVLEGDGTDPEACFAAPIAGYNGKNAVKTYGIKLENNKGIVDDTVNWGDPTLEYSDTGVPCFYKYNGYYGLTCDTYTNDSGGVCAVQFVAEIDGYQYETLTEAVTAAQTGAVVTLLRDTKEDITIDAGKNIVLDLSGKMLTNKTGHTITNSGILTIIGSGTVDNVTHAKAAVYNAPGSVANLYGGKYTRSQEKGTYEPYSNGGNSFYVLQNQGTMTIGEDANSTVSVSANGGYSSLIADGYQDGSKKAPDAADPMMTINGGNFSGGVNTVKVDECGEAKINGGTFTNYVQHSLQNWNICTVNGGAFTSIDRAAIYNGAYNSYSSGQLTVTGGMFSSQVDVIQTYSTPGTIAISGGYFTSDPSEYLAKDKVALESDDLNYIYMVGDKNTEAPAEVVPSDPEVKVDAVPADKQAEVTKAIGSAKADLNAAANSQANKNTLKAEDKVVTDALDGKVNTTGETVTIVVQPYMDIQVTEYNEDGKVMTLDITPMYRTVATTANLEKDEVVVAEDNVTGKTPNAAIVPNAGGELAVKGSVTVTIPLTDSFVIAVKDNTNNIYVEHTKDSRFVANHKATFTSGTNSDPATITFVNNKGFSQFKIKLDSRTGTIKFGANDANGTNYTPADIGTELPTVNAPAGQRFGGWIIDGKTYTTLTDALLTVLDTSKTVTAQPYFYTPSTGGPTTYTLTFDANGGTAVEKVKGKKNDVIDLGKYVTTREGYTFAGWYADEALTDPVTSVKLTKNLTVYAKWEKVDVVLPFTDVAEGAWYYDSVAYVYDKGMMNGVTPTTFAPNSTTTRGMIVTMLYRLEGMPAVQDTGIFADVEAGTWYADAVAWAAANGVVNGVSPTKFAPNDAISREQMAAILYRYATHKGYDVTQKGDLTAFTDGASTAPWAKEAMEWAVGAALIGGKGHALLDPQAGATRGEVAKIFMVFCETIAN